MPIINDVKDICDRLEGRGWRDYFLDATGGELDIIQSSRPKLLAALTAPLSSINRTKPGLEDFHATADRAITGGSPSQSLFYHALASPAVHPTSNGNPSGNSKNYPTLEELDVIENFIYSLVSDRTDLDDTFIAVFAYQYRIASRTPHLRHADVAYSRTGVARIGTSKPNYDARRRSFWGLPKNGSEAICVLPARYAAFLARWAKPGTAGSVQGGHDGANDADYVFPVHKLFSGKECLDGRDISIDFSEYHRNEKLRMTHRLSANEGGLPLPAGFDLTSFPYVRDSTNGGKLTQLSPVGSSVLVVPEPATSLVRTVAQRNSITNKFQIVHFEVPPVRNIVRPGGGLRRNRFAESSLEIPAFGADRLSPEYVNIRHRVDPNGSITQVPTDLNTLSPSAFANAIENGGYFAAHFTDDSCDGCVEAKVTGLGSPVESLPAFSLVTAIDFFPLADQSEVENDPTVRRVEPLSKGRLPVNPTLPRPFNLSSSAFDRSDTTITSIVGPGATGPAFPMLGYRNDAVSFLPDAASNVFAPGWDTSRSRDSQNSFLTSSGLGSPFPEDAKLCAALASFWPAVAPDNGRTFGNDGFGNQLPMLDQELGFHPKHDRVKSGEVVSSKGWDGEFGPFFEVVSGKLHVNYVDIARSDYVSHALAGDFKVSLTAEIQSEELITRHQALQVCESIITAGANTDVCLCVVRNIDDWAVAGAGAAQLQGRGYELEFAELRGAVKPTSEQNRVRREVQKRHTCQLGSNGIAYKDGSSAFIFRALP